MFIVYSAALFLSQSESKSGVIFASSHGLLNQLKIKQAVNSSRNTGYLIAKK